MQIVVLGMHRSGTSLITRLINMMGAYVGPEGSALGFGPDNPTGYWERADVVSLNDEILHAHGCSWNRCTKWPVPGPPAPVALRPRMRTLVLALDAHRPWVVKDPRLCVTLSCWRPLLEVPVAVIVERDPIEIAHSLQRRDAMTLSEALALWEHHAVSLLHETRQIPRVHVRFVDAIERPVEFVDALRTTLAREDVVGLRQPAAREVLAFVRPRLRRARRDPGSDPPLTARHQQLVAALRGEVDLHEHVGDRTAVPGV